MKTGWDRPLESWVDEIKEDLNKEIQRLAHAAFEKILERTPVNTGRLKAGWSLRMMEEQGIVSAVIQNNVPYVVFVEYGTPHTAPRAMVEMTLMELERGLL